MNDFPIAGNWSDLNVSTYNVSHQYLFGRAVSLDWNNKDKLENNKDKLNKNKDKLEKKQANCEREYVSEHFKQQTFFCQSRKNFQVHN